MDRKHATYAAATAAAIADYQAALGTIIRPSYLAGVDARGQFQELTIDNERIAVRVTETVEADVLHDTGGFLDPYWNVEVIEDPNGETLGIDWPWTFSPSQEFTSKD